MTSDTRSSDEIERDILEERAQMSETINNLQKKFSVEAIVDDIGTMFRSQTGDLGRVVSQTVGRNPAAVALVGVGLAWLLLGQDRSRAASTAGDPWTDQPGSSRKRETYDSWDRSGVASGRSYADQVDDPDEAWYGAARGDARQTAKRGTEGAAHAAMAQAGEAAGGMVSSIQGTASAVRHAVSSAASDVGQAASDLMARLSHGLEDLSAEARSRVVAARRAAHDARVASGAAIKKGARAATNLFEDQPLVVGALAVALGAAVGGVLPHSKIEDDTLGASSDQLFADAQALFRHERDKAKATLKMAAADVKDELRSVRSDVRDLLPEGKSVANVMVDRAADAVSRVYDRATGDSETGPVDRPQG